MLSFWYLAAEVGATRAVKVLIDFLRRVCTVTSSVAVLHKGEDSETELGSDTWEHNHIWLAVWITEAVPGPFLPRCHCDAIFDTSFACSQHLHQCKPQGNECSNKDCKESFTSHRHILLKPLWYILLLCKKDGITLHWFLLKMIRMYERWEMYNNNNNNV